MKYSLIADENTVLGFSLAGVEGYAVQSKTEILNILQKLLGDSEVGIILISSRAAGEVKEEMEKQLLTCDFPLIVEIPGFQGYEPGHSCLKERVHRAVGIHF